MMNQAFIISKTHTVILSEQDSDLFEIYHWQAIFKPPNFYAVRGRKIVKRAPNIDSYYLHREIINRIEGRTLSRKEQVDHINRNSLDNRRCNLRVATDQQNKWNSGPKGGLSRFKGVFFNRQKGRWAAKIGVDYKQIHLGFFLSEEDAAMQYDQAAYHFYGCFACPNFPLVGPSAKWRIGDLSTHNGRLAGWRGSKWAEYYDSCTSCGTKDRNHRNKHAGEGLCLRCRGRIQTRASREVMRQLGGLTQGVIPVRIEVL